MIVNALLVSWSDGMFEISSASSIAAFGRREYMLELGSVGSEDEARVKAAAEIERLAAGELEFAAEIAPVYNGDTPYLGFGVGDAIQVPNSTGELVFKRLTSVAVNEDEDGELGWQLELGNVILTAEERHQVALDKANIGSLRGNSVVATPPSQNLPTQPMAGALDAVASRVTTIEQAPPSTGGVANLVWTFGGSHQILGVADGSGWRGEIYLGFSTFGPWSGYGTYHNGMEEYATVVADGIMLNAPGTHYRLTVQTGFYQMTPPFVVELDARTFAPGDTDGQQTGCYAIADGNTEFTHFTMAGVVYAGNVSEPTRMLRILAVTNQEFCNISLVTVILEYMGLNDANYIAL